MLVGCNLEQEVEMNSWKYSELDFSELREIENDEVSFSIIQKVLMDYRKYPADEFFLDIELSKVFLDESNSQRVLVFDIAGVEDIQIIYVLNNSNVIVRKNMYSNWS